MVRRPVTCNRAFLDDDAPNTTFHLPEVLRGQLHDMGRTGDSTRPAGTHLRDVIGRLMIDLSWASPKLEGNTYSRLDTENLIRFGTAAEGRRTCWPTPPLGLREPDRRMSTSSLKPMVRTRILARPLDISKKTAMIRMDVVRIAGVT